MYVLVTRHYLCMGVILGRFVGVCLMQIWVRFGARFRSVRCDDSGFVSVGMGSYGCGEVREQGLL